ncbi:MAG: cyclophilin family peptidyl-prolyl cis-trans isomerase [Saprospiraceae bacterium]|jgi:cyclophilin family peptidyl-prolyl cis-trans isomerase
MKTSLQLLSILLVLICMGSCHSNKELTSSNSNQRKAIELVTNYGTIVFQLYNETPLHRDNFLKLTKEGKYDGLLFHRVINNFMIQSGDPDSKNAKPEDELGEGDLKYMVDAEINTKFFHKKGALGAARDDNPERASSAMQFYIVQGGVRTDSVIDGYQIRINNWLAQHFIKKDSTYLPLINEMNKAMEARDRDLYKKISDSITNIAKKNNIYTHYIIPESHREVYKTIGGTPHLDQSYTVFGEVIQGLDIVDSIANVKTGKGDRPVKDVRILSVKVLND